MKQTISILLLLASLASSTIAQSDGPEKIPVATLIAALASENPEPTERHGPDLKFPPSFDRKKREPVWAAIASLKRRGPEAFGSLIDNWEDERYSLTYSVGINGYMYNASVGKVCKIIVYDQIQPFGFWACTTDGEPRGKPKRPSYPSAFLSDGKSAKEWLEQNKGKSLHEIQLIVVDWVIEQESRNPQDFIDKEREWMQKIRKELIDSGKPISKGNYYSDDYY